MCIRLLVFLVGLLLCGPAGAQVPGFTTYFGSGQYPLSNPFAIYPYQLNALGPPFTDATGYSTTSCALVGGETTAVIIIVGQSNGNNNVNSAYTVTQARNHQLNIFDGNCYVSKGIMLGVPANNGTSTWSAIGPLLADKLIADGHYQRVILVPMGVDGSAVAQWESASSAPYLFNMIAVVARRLAAQGLTATHVQWTQGETDTLRGTSQAAYTASLNNVIAGFRRAGISAPFLVNEQTYDAGATNAAVQAAQLAASGTNVFPAANLDTITGAGRWDNVHFNAAGAATAAGLMEAQIILH